MKRKIGQIYNKPIVTGDKNLVTKNEVHESTLVGGGVSADVNKKYGYYRISPDIFDMVSETKLEVWRFLVKTVSFVVNGEFNGITSFNKIDGPEGCVNVSIAPIKLFVELEAAAELPYCSREYFNLGIKVDESDLNYSAYMSGSMVNISIKGTLLERFEERAVSEIIPYFIPITKEEYENLSNEFKE